MIYRIFHPAPLLSDIVEYYWQAKINLDQSSVQYYATPLLEGMAFNFNHHSEQHTFENRTRTLNKSAYLFGQPASPRVVTTDEKGIDLIGVKFKPLAIPKITGIKMQYIANAIIPLEDIWGNDLESLCDAMQSSRDIEQALIVLETFLIKKHAATKLHYRIEGVQNALDLIAMSKGNISIKQLQAQTNISRKTLERAFIDYVGLHPKLFNRITRFNAAKERMDRAKQVLPTGARMAADYGYYDAAHFTAEFKHFSGCTPQDYLKSTPLQLVFKDL